MLKKLLEEPTKCDCDEVKTEINSLKQELAAIDTSITYNREKLDKCLDGAKVFKELVIDLVKKNVELTKNYVNMQVLMAEIEQKHNEIELKKLDQAPPRPEQHKTSLLMIYYMKLNSTSVTVVDDKETDKNEFEYESESDSESDYY
ncbi:hypothetical protein O0L34_g12168 [Tuta absoluta]|nr:hypothetical protein O0L34_g12168 [Tuta absoluta]